MVTFRSEGEVHEHEATVRALIAQAIDLERRGVSVEVDDEPEPIPTELEERLESDPMLRHAWEALTPGRKRSHILHVGGAQQSTTRERRVAKCATKILAGKGFNEY